MMKKNLKKAVSLALAAVMAFSLAACSGGSPGQRPGAENGPSRYLHGGASQGHTGGCIQYRCQLADPCGTDGYAHEAVPEKGETQPGR